MAIIINRFLFKWQDINAKSDLERLRLVIDYLPDEDLMRKLEDYRANGRDDYPVRPVWNSLLAGIVFGHGSIESLRRELSRNAELRSLCGFNSIKGDDAVPPEWAYTRFMKNLFTFEDEINNIFDNLVNQLGELIPDYGKRLAIDSKAIDSAGKPAKETEEDGRRDTDADYGKKVYKGERKDGTMWKKVKSWFGYKLHLLVDSEYELPVAFKITKASRSDVKEAIPLVEEHEAKHPEAADRAEIFSGDKAYDDVKTITKLEDEHGISPVIDIRNGWKPEGDEVPPEEGKPNTRQLFTDRADNIMYDYKGTIYCHCPISHAEIPMAFGGFEKDRMTLKYICPVKQYGCDCPGKAECPHFMKSIRVPLDLDRRMFTPIARSSYKWKREYKKRIAVERVNSRLDVSFGWENHYIRGMKKMRVRMGLSLIVMLAMAVGHAAEGRPDMIRSLVGKVERPVKKAA